MKLILFNGPPRSGKDTSTAIMLKGLGLKAFHYRFASPLKNAVHALFGLAGIPEEAFTNNKDERLDAFCDMTPRQAYIWMSEEVAKPKFGKNFFAKVAVTEIKAKLSVMKDPHLTAVISDCGFQQEVDVLIAEFGKENVHIIHIHRMGCDYKNDSRGYIKHPDLTNMHFLRNDGTLEHLRDDIHGLMRRILQWTSLQLV